jgi:hypothetical protein
VYRVSRHLVANFVALTNDTELHSLVKDAPITIQVDLPANPEDWLRVSVGPAEPCARILSKHEAKNGVLYVLDRPLDL